MIKFEKTEVLGWEHAIRGMRNPMNSWEKSDSQCGIKIGSNDLDLMKRLREAGTDHRKFMRMITVYVDITAPLYWWKEFDTYKVGTVANSCSTMHKIAEKEFEWSDFSTEHLLNFGMWDKQFTDADATYAPAKTMGCVISALNGARDRYLDLKSRGSEWKELAKQAWWQMIQLLPNSYNQKRTVMMNYEVLANIYKSRRNHKLDEWSEHKLELRDWPKTEEEFKGRTREPLCTPSLERKYFGFCDWIKTLPYCELITGEEA